MRRTLSKTKPKLEPIRINNLSFSLVPGEAVGVKYTEDGNLILKHQYKDYKQSLRIGKRKVFLTESFNK